MFRMKIAEHLGRTLHELDHTISGEEYGMWEAYFIEMSKQ